MRPFLALPAWVGVSFAFLSVPLPASRPTALDLSKEAKLHGDDEIIFRRGRKEDKQVIQGTLLRLLMNPISLDIDNFICAEEQETNALVGFGQVRPLGGSCYELASLHVAESRRQRGLGSKVVHELMNKFVSEHGSEELRNIYLLTLASTANFYKKNGFEAVPTSDVPAVLRAEYAAGSLLQSFFGNSLVCMRAAACHDP